MKPKACPRCGSKNFSDPDGILHFCYGCAFEFQDNDVWLKERLEKDVGG